MAVSHVFSNAVADWTGTVTVFDSAGSTGTAAASAIVRPSDWNSAHNQFYTLTGNTTGNSTASGTNVIFSGGQLITLGGSTGSVKINGGWQGDTFWKNMVMDGVLWAGPSLTPFSQKPLFFPIILERALTWNRLQVPFFGQTVQAVFTMHAAIYSFSNSTKLNLLASAQVTFSATSTAVLTRPRIFEISGFDAAGTTLSAGDYVGMIYFSGATGSFNYSFMCQQLIEASGSTRQLGGIVQQGTNNIITATSQLSSNALYGNWKGAYSTTTASPPTTVGTGDLSRWTSPEPGIVLMSR